ncbi:type II secretion system protein [Bacillus sp. B-jedd]|uniref:type II secretion system protein n=1 Tax=Bacillus sp. B-jedd TaxID=1476857 RepID=UPI0005156567|nr:type II secretion system protein [Bacillus sp. B-jedd]CEG28031.1 putative Tfp assembly type protein [Bacillus sp. B-jedd]
MFKSLKKKMNDQRGLTLIELLAVIVILGIIAAIAVPAISNLIDNTRNKATVSEGLQIISSAKLYFAEHPEEKEVNKDILASYLEKGGDLKFNKVTRTQTGGGEYTLDGHDSAGLITTNATTVTEKQLLEYGKKPTEDEEK